MQLIKKMSEMPKKKKAQIITAGIITAAILVITPTYSWFRRQQEMARYEKVSSPNTLYITAASRENSINFQIGGVDVSTNAYWYEVDNTGQKVNKGRKTYQDYVFCVAGDYVYSYTLQLAHTTNNKYTYEIYEAEVMAAPPPGGVPEKEYIEYQITGDFDPQLLGEISGSSVYEAKAAPESEDKTLYYRIKQDETTPTAKPISLNAVNYTESNETLLTGSVYTINDETVTYKGHYLNWDDDFLATDDYHDDTYGQNSDGDANVNVQAHSEPLYWQAKGIRGGDPSDRDAFYHEYILRISWETTGDNAATTDFKDTDIIYITAKSE